MKNDVIFIGDVALDEYYEAERWPNLKDKIAVETLKPQFGGMIANAACVFASMEPGVRFMGMLNNSPISKMLIQNLNTCGVETGLMIYDDTLPDSKCIIILAEGEHTVFIPNMHIDHIEITENQLAQLARASYIYSTASELARVRCGTMNGFDIIAHLRQSGVKIVYDLDVGYLKDKDEKFYRNIDIAFFNEVGFNDYRGARSEQQAAQDLLSYGTEVLVVTKAEHGCDVYDKNGMFQVPALRANVVDVTGAGDTFCASFLYAYKKTGDIQYAARFANAAAGICTETVGARAGAVGEAAVLARMNK